MIKWTKVVSLAVGAAIMLNVAACNLVTVDEEKDLKQVVASVNGVEILKDEFFVEYDYLVSMYQMYGMAADDSLFETTLNSMVQTEVRRQKAEAEKLTEFSDEELAEIDTEYEEILENFREGFREEVKTELGEDAAEADIEKELDARMAASLEEQGVDLDEFKEDLKWNKIFTKQQENFNETITVSDDELKAWYDEELATQKAGIAEDPANYETYSPKLVVPEGYFYVKHILISADEETQNAIIELNNKRSPLTAEIGELAVSDSDATISAETRASNAAKRQELMLQIEEIDKQKKEAQATVDQKATEVMAKVNAGEDFDKLIEEYGEDPGTATNPDGYLISANSTGYDAAFTEASAKLAKVGDISQPTWSSFGVHIIKRVSDVAAGEKSLDEVKEEAHELVLQNKQLEEWGKTLEAWEKEYEIEKFPDRLEDNRENYNQDK